MTSFKLKNKFLIGLGSWLNELSLQGSESRERTRFVNLLLERINENEKFRVELLDKYVNKDEAGKKKKTVNPETKEEVWDISEQNMSEYVREYSELMEEDYVMDILEGNKQKLKVIKEAVLNTGYVFGPHEADTPQEKNAKLRQMNDYEVWCKSFEAIDFRD